MTSPKDAAALLGEVSDTRSVIRFLTRRGGILELPPVVAAHAFGAFVDPRQLDYSGIRIGLCVAAAFMATLMTVQTIQHRRRLGATSIALSTAITAGVVFVGNVLAFQTLHGDARELVRGALLGGSLLVLAALNRSALLLLAAGVLGLLVPSALGGLPLPLGLPAMTAWAAIVAFFTRDQLREQLALP
jgi:hypothetical protein